MQRNNVARCLKKQQYETPNVEMCCFEENDVVRTSGNGTMTWDWSGDWTPNREDTFVG